MARLTLALVCVAAALGLLDKPRYELETYGRRAFSYAGPSAWNSLPAHLRSQNVTIKNFRHSLKTDTCSPLETLSNNGLYKFTFYLLTYLLTYYTKR